MVRPLGKRSDVSATIATRLKDMSSTDSTVHVLVWPSWVRRQIEATLCDVFFRSPKLTWPFQWRPPEPIDFGGALQVLHGLGMQVFNKTEALRVLICCNHHRPVFDRLLGRDFVLEARSTPPMRP